MRLCSSNLIPHGLRIYDFNLFLQNFIWLQIKIRIHEDTLAEIGWTAYMLSPGINQSNIQEFVERTYSIRSQEDDLLMEKYFEVDQHLKDDIKLAQPLLDNLTSLVASVVEINC